MTARLRRLANLTMSTVMILMITACAAWLVPTLLGYSRYVITSGSMTGTYDKGSIVFEKNVPAADLRVGEVITYMPPANSGVGHLVTHRIYRMQPAQGGGTLFTTKGDHNPGLDPWHFKLLNREQGVVQFGVPYAGWLFIELADRSVRMLVIGVPAALIGLGALGQLLSAARHRDDKDPVLRSDNPDRWTSSSIEEQELEVV